MTIEQEAAYRREIETLRAQFETEKRCKNQAYSFILQSGLYRQWVEFCKFGLYGDNPHKECAEYLSSEAERRTRNNC